MSTTEQEEEDAEKKVQLEKEEQMRKAIFEKKKQAKEEQMRKALLEKKKQEKEEQMKKAILEKKKEKEEDEERFVGEKTTEQVEKREIDGQIKSRARGSSSKGKSPVKTTAETTEPTKPRTLSKEDILKNKLLLRRQQIAAKKRQPAAAAAKTSSEFKAVL